MLLTENFYKSVLQKPDGRMLQLYARHPISSDIKATNPKNDGQAPKPYFRWHPLRGEWVIYASHRQNRTFLPPKNYSPLAETSSDDFPTEMPRGDYDVAVFENLFPSMNLTTDLSPALSTPTAPAKGVCEVVVFTKDPDTSLAQLPLDRITLILQVLAERTESLKKTGVVKYVLPFENRGVEQGVTLHHPHGQIYAYNHIPPVPKMMNDNELRFFKEHQKTLLSTIIESELQDQKRITFAYGNAIAFIPPFARYPYETWVAPKRSVPFISDLNPEELRDFARVLKTTLMKFDKLWDKPFPYLMTLYQAPTDGEGHPESHFHIQIYPPLRTRDRLKYLAGTELGGGLYVNDSIPEEKAAELAQIQISHEEWKEV